MDATLVMSIHLTCHLFYNSCPQHQHFSIFLTYLQKCLIGNPMTYQCGENNWITNHFLSKTISFLHLQMVQKMAETPTITFFAIFCRKKIKTPNHTFKLSVIVLKSKTHSKKKLHTNLAREHWKHK